MASRSICWFFCCFRQPHGEQLNALASVARPLRKAETLRDLRRVANNDELYLAMARQL